MTDKNMQYPMGGNVAGGDTVMQPCGGYIFGARHREYMKRAYHSTVNIAEGAVRAGKTIDNLYGEWGFIETEHPWEPGLMVSNPLITVYLYPVSEGDEYVPAIDLTLVEGTVATYTDGELDTFEGQFLGSDWKLYNLKMIEAGNESAVDNITTTVVPVKVIENGQLIIIKNGVKYNATGAVVK